MKKTFTANLNGIVFHIEEDAYDQLQRYLANIRAKFSGSTEAEEIMADIESRVAELFTERLQGGRQAVNMADVDHVKQVMGQPEDYVDDDGGESTADRGAAGAPGNGQRRHKRLFRDPDDRWVGGVIGGVANYFGSDPLWFRIAFIVVVVAGWGSPVLLYCLLWILVPEATTAAEKLEMNGEPVTVDNIKRMFDEGAEKVAGDARAMGRKWKEGKWPTPDAGRRMESVAHRLLDTLGKVVGIVLLVLAILLGVTLITALVGGGATWAIAGGTGLNGLLGFLFQGPLLAMGFSAAALVLVLVPVLLLLLSAIWLLFRVRTPRWAAWGLSIAFILAITALAVSAIRLAQDFRGKGVVREDIPLGTPAGRILQVQLTSIPVTTVRSLAIGHGTWRFNTSIMDFDGDSVHLAFARLLVQPSPDSTFHLITERVARGAAASIAAQRAGHIRADWAWSGQDILSLSGTCTVPARDKMRAQHVNYILQVPMGSSIHLAPGTEALMRDWPDERHEGELEDDMAGRTWTMTPRGLEAHGETPHGKNGQKPLPPVPPPAPTGNTMRHSTDHPMPNLWDLLSRAARI